MSATREHSCCCVRTTVVARGHDTCKQACCKFSIIATAAHRAGMYIRTANRQGRDKTGEVPNPCCAQCILLCNALSFKQRMPTRAALHTRQQPLGNIPVCYCVHHPPSVNCPCVPQGLCMPQNCTAATLLTLPDHIKQPLTALGLNIRQQGQQGSEPSVPQQP